MLDIYDMGFPSPPQFSAPIRVVRFANCGRYRIYESNSHPVRVLDLKDPAAMKLEPPYAAPQLEGARETREIVDYREKLRFIVFKSCFESCYFSKESCIIVLYRVKNKESFFRPKMLDGRDVPQTHRRSSALNQGSTESRPANSD